MSKRNDKTATLRQFLKYALGHFALLGMLFVELWFNALFLPVIGVLLNGIALLCYTAFLIWRAIQFMRNPAREIAFFSRLSVGKHTHE